MSEDHREQGVEMILGFAFATAMGTIRSDGAFSLVAPHIDAIRSRWTLDGDPMGIAKCITSANGANIELLDTAAQVDMTIELGGPTLELLLERDVLRALVGEVNLLVEANASRLLEILLEHDGFEEETDRVEETLAHAMEYPSSWYISTLNQRTYYEAPLRSLAEKMKVTMEGTR